MPLPTAPLPLIASFVVRLLGRGGEVQVVELIDLHSCACSRHRTVHEATGALSLSLSSPAASRPGDEAGEGAPDSDPFPDAGTGPHISRQGGSHGDDI